MEGKVDQVLWELRLIRERLEALERALGEELPEEELEELRERIRDYREGRSRSSPPWRKLRELRLLYKALFERLLPVEEPEPEERKTIEEEGEVVGEEEVFKALDV